MSSKNTHETEPMTQEQLSMQADYNWAENDPGIRQKYGGQIVAVYQRSVLAAAEDYGELLENAPNHPAYPTEHPHRVVLVPIPPHTVGSRQPRTHP